MHLSSALLNKVDCIVICIEFLLSLHFLGFSVIEKLKEIMSEVEISINSMKEEQRSW